MRVRCEASQPLRPRAATAVRRVAVGPARAAAVVPQAGAALVVGLVLVAAVGMLTTAAMQELTLETAKTAHLAARVQARLAADSAIDMTIAAQTFPDYGARTVSYRLGPDAAFAAEVTIRFLGTAISPSNGAAEDSGAEAGYYEIVAEVHGPRGSRERRKLDWIRYTPPQT